jgi:hypothetical protein
MLQNFKRKKEGFNFVFDAQNQTQEGQTGSRKEHPCTPKFYNNLEFPPNTFTTPSVCFITEKSIGPGPWS